MTRGFLIGLAVIALAGCKTTVETQVSLTDLLSGPTKAISSDLYVEVAGCNDFEDSRKPSSSLVETQQQIPGIFKDAEYVECFRRQMDSFAYFKLPVYLSKDENGMPASEDHINLVSNDASLLLVVVPKPIQQKLEAEKKKMMGPSLDMRMSIKIQNDTGKEFAFRAISVFVNDSPIVYADLTAHKDGEFLVTLSDVSIQSAITGASSPILFHLPQGS